MGDSLGAECDSDSVLCGDDGVGSICAPPFPALSLTQPALTASPALSLTLSASAIEEETYSRLAMNMENVGFELCDTLDTPSNEAADILNSYLADTDMMAMAGQEDKWTASLDDLFPDLD